MLVAISGSPLGAVTSPRWLSRTMLAQSCVLRSSMAGPGDLCHRTLDGERSYLWWTSDEPAAPPAPGTTIRQAEEGRDASTGRRLSRVDRRLAPRPGRPPRERAAILVAPRSRRSVR